MQPTLGSSSRRRHCFWKCSRLIPGVTSDSGAGSHYFTFCAVLQVSQGFWAAVLFVLLTLHRSFLKEPTVSRIMQKCQRASRPHQLTTACFKRGACEVASWSSLAGVIQRPKETWLQVHLNASEWELAGATAADDGASLGCHSNSPWKPPKSTGNDIHLSIPLPNLHLGHCTFSGSHISSRNICFKITRCYYMCHAGCFCKMLRNSYSCHQGRRC